MIINKFSQKILPKIQVRDSVCLYGKLGKVRKMIDPCISVKMSIFSYLFEKIRKNVRCQQNVSIFSAVSAHFDRKMAGN